jgi:HEAT repeat protein
MITPGIHAVIRVSLLIVVGTAMSGAVSCSREQQVDGHPIAYWAQALKSPDPATRAAAAKRFVEVAPRSRATAQVLVSALATESNHNVHVTIAQALGSLGPAAAGSVPGLSRLLLDEHPDVRRAAAEALGNLGPIAASAVPALAVATRDHDHEVRIQAAEALGNIGPAARSATAALAEAIHDPISDMRLVSVTALGRLGQPDGAIVDAYAHALRDPWEEVQLMACKGLRTALLNPGGLSSHAADLAAVSDSVAAVATAALQRVAGSPDSAVSSCAATALSSQGRGAARTGVSKRPRM